MLDPLPDTPQATGAVSQPLTTQAIAARPELATFRVRWNSETLAFRPLRADDAERLGRYFESLSPTTTSMFGPHAFTMQSAHEICGALDQSGLLRMVALRGTDEDAPIVAYFILYFGLSRWGEFERYAGYGIALDEHTCGIGPSVADALQGQGLASALMGPVRELARRYGCRRILLLGGVFTVNARAIRFYERVGFQRVGTFELEGQQSYDMMMPLAE